MLWISAKSSSTGRVPTLGEIENRALLFSHFGPGRPRCFKPQFPDGLLDRNWLRHRLRNRVRLRFGASRRNEIWIRSRLRLWIGLRPRMRAGNRWRDRCCYREKRHFLSRSFDIGCTHGGTRICESAGYCCKIPISLVDRS